MAELTQATQTRDIERPRLDTLLAEAVQAGLCVVHAGGGFGKTQAVAGYLQRSAHRGVWVQLTHLDNLPTRFWENFTAVVSLHRPALGARMQQLGFPGTLSAFNTFLTEFTCELYQDDQFVVLVFDDAHVIEDPQVKGFIENVVSARMENSSVVLITRQWPLLEREVTVPTQVVGVPQLRFTLQEAEALFAANDVAIGSDELAAIYDYVTGWPIALSMAALVLKRQRMEGRYDAGKPLFEAKPALFTLFEQEVFSQYTKPEQEMLVQLSVLDSFPRGLVHAVTGERGRGLSEVMGGNIFIQYDPDAKRFYFHPLYLEFLQEKLLDLKRSELEDAYRRAAVWCRENGHYYDAITYYEQCGDHEGVWDTLLRLKAVRHSRSEADFFIGKIENLPDAFRLAHPMTMIVLAVMLTNNLHFTRAMQVLDDVQERLVAGEETDENRQLLGECHTARGLLLLGMEQNGFEKSFREAARLLPNGSGRWGSGLTLVDIGPGINLQSAKAGELKKSLACFTEGVPYMVQVLHGAGQGLDKLVRCEAAFLTGDLKSAEAEAYSALYDAQKVAQHDIAGNALFMLLRIHSINGSYQKALEALDEIQRYQDAPESADLAIWDVAKGWFFSDAGMPQQVASWIMNATQSRQPPISVDRELLVRARCLIALDRDAEALALLDYHEDMVEKKKAVVSLLYINICRAVALGHLGRHGDALASLKAAYNLAKGNELIMPFIEYGNRTRSLLERAKTAGDTGIPAQWLDTLHTRANTYAKRHAYLTARYRQAFSRARPEYQLSRRELELLNNLSQGLTREEIAESMVLSLNTVKSMLKQVYSKLGAINSADAVRIVLNAGII